MALKILTLAAAALFAASSGSAATPERLGRDVKAGIDALAAETIAAWPLPGVAIAIVDREGTLHSAGFGVTGDGANGAVDADTLFLINSMTKAMSAAVVGSMVDEGRLGWSDPVKRHLPWFRVADPVVSDLLSIEDALVHRSGVECNDWLEDVPGMTWDEGLRRHRHLGQATPFRTRYHYCNWVFSLAGRIAADIDGGWAQTLERRLFTPLGMERSVPVAASAIAPTALTACHECELVQPHRGPELRDGFRNVAMPHFDRQGRLVRSPWRNSAAVAAGSVLSSANDLAVYARMLLNKGAHQGRQVLSEQVVRDMFEPRIPQGSGEGYPALAGFEAEAGRIRDWSSAYGYGWEVGSYAGRRAVHHGGGSLGFESKIALLPEQGIGVVVLINYNHRNWGASDVLMFGILDRLLGLEPGKWKDYVAAARSDGAAEAPAEAVGRSPAPASAAVPPALVGAYCHPVYGQVTIAKRRKGYELNQGPERRGRLLPLGDNRFSLRWNGPRDDPNPVRLDADGAVLQIGDDEGGVRFPRCAAVPGAGSASAAS